MIKLKIILHFRILSSGNIFRSSRHEIPKLTGLVLRFRLSKINQTYPKPERVEC